MAFGCHHWQLAMDESLSALNSCSDATSTCNSAIESSWLASCESNFSAEAANRTQKPPDNTMGTNMELARLHLAFMLLWLMSVECLAQTEVSPGEGLKHVGKEVRVTFVVESMGMGGGYVQLKSETDWKEPACFIARLAEPVQQHFLEMQAGESLVETFSHQKVEVVGTVTSWKLGEFVKPTIVVESADAIQLVVPKRVSEITLSQLVDRNVELHLRNGQRYANVRVVSVKPEPATKGLTGLVARIAGTRRRSVTARDVEEILIDGIPLDVTFSTDSKSLVIDHEKRAARVKREQETDERLRANGCAVWQWVTLEEHAEWMRKHHEFAESVQARFTDTPLKVYENEHFLLLTDLTLDLASQCLKHLDSMYEMMCRAYGVAQGGNIWCGKCVVVAFQQQSDYIRFQKEVMNNPRTVTDLQTSGGGCHARKSGQVIIALWRGSSTFSFTHKLIHETSHGFIARYRSDVRMPSWLNEGLADWIAVHILKSSRQIEARGKRALAMVQTQRSLNGMFETQQIKGDYYGVAVAVVDMLLERDTSRFRDFIIAIKDGHAHDEALNLSYGMTYADVARNFGRRIGVRTLRP